MKQGELKDKTAFPFFRKKRRSARWTKAKNHHSLLACILDVSYIFLK
jgi:hypothetical protein